ncbi:MAG: hypothetical protein ACOYJB_02820 [Christensenellaceae bacterium]|jgi:hexokinase
MSSASDFIKKHSIGPDTISIENEMETYLCEMERGLSRESSSLAMLPSFIALNGGVLLEKPIVCVDAGGTNLRITQAWFNAHGEFSCGGIDRRIMPGAVHALSAEEFFEALAECIAPYLKETPELALSFAYPGTIFPSANQAFGRDNIDCEILKMTKEIKVRGLEGKNVGAELSGVFKKMGISPVRYILLNDTVATALAGMAEGMGKDYGTYVGTILGTGSNSCYVEKTTCIAKASGFSQEGCMLVNIEAGWYDKLPRSGLDIAFDKTQSEPGRAIAEKMVSGAYLGNLCLFVLQQAVREGVLRSEKLLQTSTLSGQSVSAFLKDGSGALAGLLLQDDGERQAAREIIFSIVRRGARVGALQMAAAAEKAVKTNNTLCLTAEGATYEKMYGLKEELKSALFAYLEKRGYSADLKVIENAVLKGCAIAGLCN